jgi:predicted HTH domain antitoxin
MEIKLTVPDTITMNSAALKMQIAVDLYENGILDSGYAAKAAGVTRREFIEKMPQYGVSIFDRSPEELEEDIENVRAW